MFKKNNSILTLILFVAGLCSASPALAEGGPGVVEKFVNAKTEVNFNDTMIDGKMRAPQGFYLRGRNKQSLSQMVKLRSNFRNELRNSKAGVKSLTK